MKLFDRMLRSGEGRKLRALTGLVPDIGALGDEHRKLTDDELRSRTAEFRQRLERGEPLDDLLIEAFATVREAADRVLGQRPYDVQLMGGAALHFGWVAEMRTGEGKTLVSTMPAYLNALAGHGVHLVTVNDYLARRDAAEMGRVHRWLGLEVGLAVDGLNDTPAARRAAYAADITYGTNNEMGFDYLRDNMARSAAHKVQRGHHFCIVDEIDSILIDEARTPLIISGRSGDAAGLYQQFTRIAAALERDVDYEIEEDKRAVVPLPAGIAKVEEQLAVGNLYDPANVAFVHQLGAALRAKELFRRDRDYVVDGGEVKIVDEFTGRIQEGRRWSEGLHQAVEAKEGVTVRPENHTMATVTLQNYFRMYDKLAGMTGTAASEAAELAGTYELEVVSIPTHRPVRRVDHPDLVFRSETDKFTAIADDVAERHAAGQPVLVGTASVKHSETLSKLFTERGIPHNVLNAKLHTAEGPVVAQAGRPGAVTVATNMAGRGVDIKLGGNPELLARAALRSEGFSERAIAADFELVDELTDDERDERERAQHRYLELVDTYRAECDDAAAAVRAAGGLYVIGSERHESRRIDNQLRGRSGRQGDPGETRFYLALDDEMLRLFAPQMMNWAFNGLGPGEAIESKTITKAVERAQGTVEVRNAEIRKNVLDFDEVLDVQRTTIYALRDDILAGRDLRERALAHINTTVRSIVDDHCSSGNPADWDHTALTAALAGLWAAAPDTTTLTISGRGDLTDQLERLAADHYDRLEREIGADAVRNAERHVMLDVVDRRWLEHLADMDYLRDSVTLRSVAQLDPLVQWQKEGFALFETMMGDIAEQFAQMMMHARIEHRDKPAGGDAAGTTTDPGPG